MVVDFPDPVGPVIRMIHLSAVAALSIDCGSDISAGVGMIDGIIRMAIVIPLIVRLIFTRNRATP